MTIGSEQYQAPKLKDLCTITSSKRVYAADYVEDGVPFVRGKEVVQRFSESGSLESELFITRAKFETLRDRFGAPTVGDVLLTSVGTLGVPYLVTESDEFYFKDGNLLWFRNFDGLNSEFFYYWIQSHIGRAELAKCRIGTSQGAYTIERLKEIESPRHSNCQQKSIASILSAYDDLIENNRRRIQLLEQAARLLYREWFVHLRFPGHEHVTITDGVPEGWERMDLNSVISIKHGYAFKGEFFSEEPTSRVLLTPGNFKIGGGIKLDKLKYYSEEGPLSEEYVVQQNDLLLTMTDLSKSSDTLGYPLLVPRLSGTVFLHNQRLGVVKAKNGIAFYPHFLDQLFRDSSYQSFVKGSASGTSVKHTSPKRILAYKPVLPPYERSGLVRVFNDSTRSINAQCQTLLRANESLAEARDLLLPRLMNGEIEANIRMEATV